MEYDLVVSGGHIVTGDSAFPATLGIREGRIATIMDAAEEPRALEWVDARSLWVLPGAIDTHVHLRDPAAPEHEDFLSGTSAAAAGGITTILEMPSSHPPVNSAEVLFNRVSLVQPKAVVDFALYGGAGHGNLDEISRLADAGVVAFKTFLTAPSPGRHGYSREWCDDASVGEVMTEVAKTRLRHCFHCENDAMKSSHIARLRAMGRMDGIAYAESRPPVVEDTSVASTLAAAAHVGASVSLVHTSTPLAVQLAKEARARGVDVTVETCPQYLFLTEDALKEYGPYAVCTPPLRGTQEVEGLWRHLVAGDIDMLGSDHAPHSPESKERAWQDILSAPGGMPGLEVLLPLMLTAVNQGRLGLSQLVRLVAEQPASIFRLTRKGRIALGGDADLALVDMHSNWTFDFNRCFSKSRESMKVYQGWKMQGRIIATFVRGVCVYREGEVVGKPGHGKFVRPAPRDGKASSTGAPEPSARLIKR